MDKSVISLLSSEDAQNSLSIFFELMPPEMWGNKKKPSHAEIEEFEKEALEKAPSEKKTKLYEISSEGNADTKRKYAVDLLQVFYEQIGLRPCVTQAISKTTNPSEAILSSMVPVIIFLLSIQIDCKDGECRFSYNPDKIVEHIDILIKNVESIDEFLKHSGPY